MQTDTSPTSPDINSGEIQMQDVSELQIYTPGANQFGQTILLQFLKSSVRPDISVIDVVSKISTDIFAGYNNLFYSGLISDPVIETTLALAILPFVPFSIVKRTKKGQIVYRKIQAGLWKYERERRSRRSYADQCDLRGGADRKGDQGRFDGGIS